MGILNFFKKVEKKDEKLTTAVTYCPYCKTQFEKVPSRKSKCKNCGNYYYVRTNPTTKEKLILTEKDTKEFDGGVQLKEALMSVLSEKQFKELYGEVRLELETKFKMKPLENDILWGISNKTIMFATRKNNFEVVRIISFAEALFLHNKGEEESIVFQEVAQRLSLKPWQDGGLKKTQILANCCCDECKKQDGMIFTIEDAIAQKVLPCRQCSNKINSNCPTGWCTCSYLPVID